MSLFDRFKKQKSANPANVMYELLFCDNIDLYAQNNQQPQDYPWNILFSSNPSENDLQTIINDESLESRIKLLVYHKLRAAGHTITNKELLGVIVEVGMDGGLDVLASYKDGRARFISYSGRMIIWETTDATSNQLTEKLFAESEKIVAKIGPWNNPRRPHPSTGMARISFLVSDGLYFGEAPMNTLFADPLASGALMNATSLMQYITEKDLSSVG